jgi:hypothetical protein
MKTVSRRRAITLASSFAAAPLLNSIDSLAQPGTPAAVFDMANFTAASPDHDAAFAKAVAAISEAAAEANKAGRPAHIVLNLDKNAIYRIKRPIVLKQVSGIEVHGNGAQLINTARASTLQISDASHVTIRDLAIDYDPLPFTQGTIASFDRAAREIIVKVDTGYPDDPALLATITDGFFKVMDRRTRALKPGARDFLSPSRVERVKDGVIKVHLQWGANDRFPSQLPIVVGDVVAITNSSGDAIGVTGSVSTTLINLKLLASPGMGIAEDAGAGGTRLQKVSVVPGLRPKGATTDRRRTPYMTAWVRRIGEDAGPIDVQLSLSERSPMNGRSTLDITEIEAERKRRGPAVIRLDRNGREIYEPDGAVLTQFATSNNKVDITQGPIGSGKTIAAFRRLGRHAMQQEPSPRDGLRKTRWFVARNTFP